MPFSALRAVIGSVTLECPIVVGAALASNGISHTRYLLFIETKICDTLGPWVCKGAARIDVI